MTINICTLLTGSVLAISVAATAGNSPAHAAQDAPAAITKPAPASSDESR
ncbi:hypothetical protein ACUJ46_03770 [Sandaracinobacteroides sp. A072]